MTSSKPAGVLGKYLSWRLRQAKGYILSRKPSFMRTLPSDNCDIIITFPESPDRETPLWLLNLMRLGLPQVSVQVRQHKQTWADMLFITASFENLLLGAEQVGVIKAVKPQYGGGKRRFLCEESNIYLNIESEVCFLSSQERQSIIKFWLDNLRADQGEVLHNLHFLEGQPIIPELLARGVVQQMFPLHDERVLALLMTSWVQAVCDSQPLDDVCEYFGVKIAMYFAWLGFYTSAMVYPALIGCLLWVLADQTSQDICCVLFALFNVVWATLFLEGWKRRGAELAYKWGTLDTPTDSLEEPRPQFRGVQRVSPVTGCEEFYYPPWRRAVFRWMVSLPVCMLCLAFVFLAMLLCLELQEFVMSVKELPNVTRFLPKILQAITVSVCDEVYKRIAYWLNNMENYRLQSDYENNLIIKIVVFQFINSYLSLFYIGFYLKDMERLKEMLATLLIFRQIMQNFVEVLQPYLYEHHKLGVFTPRVLWEQAHTGVLKYGRLALGKAQAFVAAYCKQASRGLAHPETRASERGRRGDLKAGFRLSEEEWEQSDGLRHRKVCFTETVAYNHPAATATPADTATQQGAGPLSFLEDSPTLLEDGMHATSLFTLDDSDHGDSDHGDSDHGDSEAETADAVANTNITTNGSEAASQNGHGQADRKQDRKSWIDPPLEEEACGLTLTQAEIQSCMQTYESTLEDYQEMFIQFGYVVLFSSAFPLAALCALINNVIEIRSDALKLCCGFQRPFGERVDNIGQWQTVMEVMGLIAIIVNCYLIGQCGQLQRLLPWMSPEMIIICIVLLEHFAVLLKYVIHVAIPDVPVWVAEEMAKLEYRRREAFKKHERQAQQHFQQQQRQRREEAELQRQEAELQRQAELQAEARLEGSGKAEAHQHHHAAGGGKGGGGDKPRRPSSLLGSNKLKQIIPLQGKLSGSPRSPQTPPGGEAKLPAFLNKLLNKSPEVKKEAAAPGGPERPGAPGQPFSPGRQLAPSRSGGTVVSGGPGGPGGDGRATPEELPSSEGERGEGERGEGRPGAMETNSSGS
ncbi:anoctamin-8-like [Osmerus mordax]|uniref:anoctamin-8-like n=1 Tax=Osmerus mordax TaxID=8014 RepID=UPI00350ED3C7